MESARWERIQHLFHGATERSGPEQRAFLIAACAGDEALMADVLALLDEDAYSSSPLDRSVPDLAQEVLAARSISGIGAQDLGPYRLRRLLGEGGMGVVYLAERTDLGTLVAIKLLSDAWLSPARLSRFAAEQRMLAQLDHPSIARLYDARTLADGTPFFVMEYVDGKPLTDYCRERAATLDERLLLFRALCQAVQFAHRHAIIHRDIKPSNVLVKRDGSVRLLDFGIAKQVEDTDSPASQMGLHLLTPAYAAPEQLRGDRVGIYTDIYSLGVVLYELLSGRLPFDGARPSARSGTEGEARIHQEPDRASVAARSAHVAPVTASDAAWADLDVLIRTAMRFEPERRYASVEALIRDIDHYLAGRPLEARPADLAYRLRKFALRQRRRLALAGLMLALVVGLVVFVTAGMASMRNAALARAARAERLQRFIVSMFAVGGPAVEPAGELRALRILDRGAKEARLLDNDPEVQADLFRTLGTAYRTLGEFDSAEPLLRSALERHQVLDGDDGVAAMDDLVMLALLRGDQARYDEAEELLRRAVGIGKRRLPSDDEHVLIARAALESVRAYRSHEHE